MGLGAVWRPTIGGAAATEGQIASAVALLDAKTGELLCTGTLIAPTVVASAAHCVAIEDLTTHAIHEKAPGELLVVAGALDVMAATPDQRHEIARIIRHPGYPGPISDMDPDGLGEEDDLCLLFLTRVSPFWWLENNDPLRSQKSGHGGIGHGHGPGS